MLPGGVLLFWFWLEYHYKYYVVLPRRLRPAIARMMIDLHRCLVDWERDQKMVTPYIQDMEENIQFEGGPTAMYNPRTHRANRDVGSSVKVRGKI